MSPRASCACPHRRFEACPTCCQDRLPRVVPLHPAARPLLARRDAANDWSFWCWATSSRCCADRSPRPRLEPTDRALLAALATVGSRSPTCRSASPAPSTTITARSSAVGRLRATARTGTATSTSSAHACARTAASSSPGERLPSFRFEFLPGAPPASRLRTWRSQHEVLVSFGTPGRGLHLEMTGIQRQSSRWPCPGWVERQRGRPRCRHPQRVRRWATEVGRSHSIARVGSIVTSTTASSSRSACRGRSARAGGR
jgi:hypothetical protein